MAFGFRVDPHPHGRTLRTRGRRHLAFALRGAARLGPWHERFGELQFVGGVSYTVARKNAEITATLQQAALSSGGDTLVSTNLALAYRRQITQYSSWEAELSYLATDELIANESEDETTATIGYRRDLNSDWSMFTGYEYTKGDGSPQTSLFLNLERDITFGF